MLPAHAPRTAPLPARPAGAPHSPLLCCTREDSNRCNANVGRSSQSCSRLKLSHSRSMVPALGPCLYQEHLACPSLKCKY